MKRRRAPGTVEVDPEMIWAYADAKAAEATALASRAIASAKQAHADWRAAHTVARVEIERAARSQREVAERAARARQGRTARVAKEDKVIVNPLRIREKYLDELAHNLVLYHTETSRLSSVIIEQQKKNGQQIKLNAEFLLSQTDRALDTAFIGLIFDSTTGARARAAGRRRATAGLTPA